MIKHKIKPPIHIYRDILMENESITVFRNPGLTYNKMPLEAAELGLGIDYAIN